MIAGAGGGGGRRGMGADVETVVRVSFLEAVNGCNKTFSFDYTTPITQQGQQRQRKTKSVTVDVPAGVDNNIQMRVQGKGGEGAPGMPAGDLFVRLQVEEDPYFKRDGMHVHTEQPISFVQAVVGSQVEVLTLDGMVKMTVRAGTQPGSVLSMRNKGIKHVQQPNRRGNQYVTLKVKVPTKIDDRQMELLKEFEEIESQKAGSPSAEKMTYSTNSAWSRIKNFVSESANDVANAAAKVKAAADAVDAANKEAKAKNKS